MRRVQSNRSFFSRLKANEFNSFSPSGALGLIICLFRLSHSNSDVFFYLDAMLLIRAAKHDPERAAISRSIRRSWSSMSWPRSRRWQNGTAPMPRAQIGLLSFCGKATSLWWMWHDEQRGPAFCQETGRGRSRRLSWGCQDITQCAVGEEQCAGPVADARGRGIRVEEQRRNLIYCKKKN